VTIEQENIIELLINDAKRHNYIIGLILCGSLAKNNGNENSDIDLYVIVDDEEFETRKLSKNYFCGTIFNQSNYSVYVDGKIINKDFLKKIWTEGNECIKNTFSQVKILFSLDTEINDMLKDMDKTNYDKEENIKKFYALMKSYKFKANDDINNIIQIKHSIFFTIFFACRLILSHNNVYYPCIKNMEKEVKKCTSKPKDFIKNMHKLLETFSLDELEVFYNETEEYFKEYRFDDKIRKGYVIENEDYWFFNQRPYSEI
jgi:predicted nucleotidyltransferase